MKFVCVKCDEQMNLVETDSDRKGALSVLFLCPECDNQVSMLTNPGETQMVNSLGVRIGAEASVGESQCPFGEMVREMERTSEEVDIAGWTKEALRRLNKIPEFVRPMAKQGIEHYAKSKGYSQIDQKVLDEARELYGM